ncbi:pyruvate formate lyase family protein [Youngiibacter fragilis]|uniref:Pyruvate formate-lyase n=1 Tax=Youngiibacter fragilis 232.1 TaxID=994573 RepID=V7I9D4_9CLOT|nr:pyruvate formate lyase family protein [Youngiibacter fragilis]ETA81886.1 hypothetical protein T472_0204100 [Youngiibacter fragilis 232.1]
MYDRIERIKKRVVVDTFPICIEKYRITLDVMEQTKNDPVEIQRAKIFDATVDRMPISIADDELIVGIGASKPMGLEIDPHYGIWSQEEIESLIEDGFEIDPQDVIDLQELNKKHNPSTLIGQMGEIFYENERIISLLKTGLILPPWQEKESGKGVGGGYAQSGLGLGPSLVLLAIDYTKPIYLGTNAMIAQAEEEKSKIQFYENGSVEKYRYYESVIMCLKAMNKLAARYSKLASDMASVEKDETRRKELEEIAEICMNVPANPARSFKEAIQAFWFTFLMLSPSTTLPGCRFDQYMYPFYKNDLEDGKITEEEAVELLCCLRLKDMELNRTSGKNNRKKNAGMAKWHNFTIGGVKSSGEDGTNDLTYMLLDAAKITKTPHHTLTLRIHEGTPRKLMVKALEVVRMGLGLPAFVGEESYIKTFTSRGVSIEDAREFVMTGCLDANIPGKSRTGPVPMVTIPLIFDIFRHQGIDSKTGKPCGINAGDFTKFQTFEELFDALKKEMDYCYRIVGEKNNVELKITQELLPDPLRSCFMHEGIESGVDTFCRTMPFENGAVLNPIGMVNVGDSLAAIKKLVFDEKKYTLSNLYDALESNWTGYEAMRKDFLEAPKFGNNIDYVDSIVAECYKFLCDTADTMPTILGGVHIPTGISITSHQPGGGLTGATPDGRFSGEILADGTMSPMHGMDTHGPLAVLSSAMKIDQDPFQATLLNMKFHPSALKTEDDLDKLASMVQTYLTNGGKHIQFNVVDKETLIKAKENPKEYRDLVVRIAGYSAYFVQLNPQMQDEVIARVEHNL